MDMPIEITDLFWKFYFNTLPNLYRRWRAFDIIKTAVLFSGRSFGIRPAVSFSGRSFGIVKT